MPDNLPELRDIHLPEGVSIWPPAYGWWLILAVVVLLWFSGRLFKFLRLKSKKIYAKRLLREKSFENPVVAAAKISEILRRICVVKYPQALALSGKEWTDFLSSHAKENLSQNTADLLQNAPYMPEEDQVTDEDLKNLKNFCEDWIGENL